MVLWIVSVENVNAFLYLQTEKYVYIRWSMTSQSKIAQTYLYPFLVQNFIPISNIYSYIRLYFLENITVAFFESQIFVSWKIGEVSVVICRAFFFETEYSTKTKFYWLFNDKVRHLRSVKPGLICTKYWI